MLFKVRGWYREDPYNHRSPMKLKTVEAEDGKDAAHFYTEQWYPYMNLNEWWNAGPRPRVVIRVSRWDEVDP